MVLIKIHRWCLYTKQI